MKSIKTKKSPHTSEDLFSRILSFSYQNEKRMVAIP